MQKKKVIYIAHPISGDIAGNLRSIRAIGRKLNMSNPNIVPFAPYYFDVCCLDDNHPLERERGIQNDIALFERGCIDEVHLYGDKISEGMKAEILLAKRLGIPVICTSDDLYAQYITFLNSKNLPELQEN